MKRPQIRSAAGALAFCLTVALLLGPGILARQPAGSVGSGATAPSTASTQLCNVIGCGQPLISQILQMPAGFSPNQVSSGSAIKPGEFLIVYGQNFLAADRTSQLVLNLVQPRTRLTNVLGPAPSTSYPLANLQWVGTAAFALVPANITGVMDQQATLQVLRGDGAKSNLFNVQFLATRDIQPLPPSDVQVNCPTRAGSDQCNNWTDNPPAFPSSVFSIFGWHSSNTPSCPSPDQPCTPPAINGTDQFNFLLKNGWLVAYWANLSTVDAAGTGDASSLDATLRQGRATSPYCDTTFNPEAPCQYISEMDAPPGPYPVPFPLAGLAEGRYSVTWTSVYNLQYQLTIFIEGPKGVPWH